MSSGPIEITEAEIDALASEMGYSQRRSKASYTLFYKEDTSPHGMPPVLINIYYTTRSVMTFLNHITTGSNELWRSNAYASIEELREIFRKPRIHTGKGYRNKDKAVRGCVKCGEMKKRLDFSKNQWIKGPDLNKCKECVISIGNNNVASTGLVTSLLRDIAISESEDDTSEDDYSDVFPTLTEDLLKLHDVKSSTSIKPKMERRQFNCPECPKRGRGKHVFFKPVPAMKPIVKCPKCKRASRGKCKRLYPIPKHQEKGYGLFKCLKCVSTWGSSRACGNIGQECIVCSQKSIKSLVKPHRMEVVRAASKGITGSKPFKRVPKQPIREDEEEEVSYGNDDFERNRNAAGNALARSGDDVSGKMYTFNPKSTFKPDEVPSAPEETPSSSSVPKATTYVHKCEGCARGLCRSRKLPISSIHDTSDGNTVSTSASVVTNSSVDKNFYVDRDRDFDDFED
mmetsp:Transcript_30363/g.34938  ORF Transcript_30363/g.34938 Transcript_30363/m.34938 type:complete len:456 (-) Transcript_30363:43-1410(-)